MVTLINLQSWKLIHMFLLGVPQNGFFIFSEKNIFRFFFRKNVLFRSFQHNFVPSTLRNIILVSIPLFSGTSNRMMTFWNVPDEQGYQIWTLWLPDLHFLNPGWWFPADLSDRLLKIFFWYLYSFHHELHSGCWGMYQYMSKFLFKYFSIFK